MIVTTSGAAISNSPDIIIADARAEGTGGLVA
jgi:hypothetical protein